MVSGDHNLTYNSDNISVSVSREFNGSHINKTLNEEIPEEDSILVHYVLYPLGIVICLLVILGLAAFIIRKKRLDKLRHHLMPLYSFDPAEEGEDWEAELLEEGTDHTPRGKNTKSTEQPQLSFHGNL